MATYTLTVPRDVWVNDACSAVITPANENGGTSGEMESVRVLLSMSSSTEEENDPYSQFDTELTLDGWLDDKITFSFRDFARSAYNYGMDYITMQIVEEEEEEEETEAEVEGEAGIKTIYLHGGIRPAETIYPLTEYRVAEGEDEQPVYFVGKGLTLYGVNENTCPPPGNLHEEETSALRTLKREGTESDNPLLWYACASLPVGSYRFTAPGGVTRVVKVRALQEPCEKIKARWTGMFGFEKAWVFEAGTEQLTAEDNVDFYDMETIGYPHRSGYRMTVTGISRGLTMEQRRYLSDIGGANDLRVDWIQDDLPARVGSAPSVSLGGYRFRCFRYILPVACCFLMFHVKQKK